MKHRLVEFLATEMGFNVFAIENVMPKTQRINDFVLGGEGNSMRLLKGLSDWPTYSQEVLNLIEWIRKFNQSREEQIEFTGFDVRYPFDAIQTVIEFVSRVNPEYSAQVKGIYANIMRSGGPSGGALGTFPHEVAAGKTDPLQWLHQDPGRCTREC